MVHQPKKVIPALRTVIGNYGLPVVIRAAVPQKGGEIAWTWIQIRRYTNDPMMVFITERTVRAGGRFVKILGVLLIILARLCWLTKVGQFWHGSRVW